MSSRMVRVTRPLSPNLGSQDKGSGAEGGKRIKVSLCAWGEGVCCFGFPLPHDAGSGRVQGCLGGGRWREPHPHNGGWGRDCPDSPRQELAHQPGPGAPTVTGTLPWQHAGPGPALGVPLAEAPRLQAKPGSLDCWAARGLTRGLVPTVCNFMSHEKCVRQVKTPCACVAPSLVRVRMAEERGLGVCV